MLGSLRGRAALLGGTALLAGSAVAQTTGVAEAQAAQGAAAARAPTTAATAAPPEAGGGAEIVVTGSRIARPDFAAPSPIVSFNATNLQQSGNTNLTTFLERVPALTNSLDSTRTAGLNQADGAFGQAGLNLLDLRGLGPERTLVLVNGRRHVAGQVNSAAVDINSIPTDLVERVDVLTGAASAVYGADAVSGVVNFVLKRDFEGVAARTQLGVSSRGDAANRFASVQAGHNFAGGRGNITLAYEYDAEQPLANDDRSYLRYDRRGYFVNQDNYVPGQPGSYQLGYQRDLRYPYSSTYGIVYIGDQTFRGDGRIYTPGRQLVNDAYSVGGDDTPVAGYIGDIFPRVRRHDVNLLSHFDASDAFKLSVEAKFVQTKTATRSGYGGDYPAEISLDNPYIPAPILAAAQAAGLSSIEVNRNNFDLPRRGEADRRRTYRGVVDVSGRISDHATYDAYYEYGRTSIRITHLGDRLNDRFLAALDAVRAPNGQIVCRSSLTGVDPNAVTYTPGPNSGCVPVNLFGANTVDPRSYGFYIDDNDSFARLNQQVANASISGDFGQFFSLPGGPVAFAVGGEYRRESSNFRPNSLLTNNQFYQYDEYIIPSASGGRFNVKEAFGELNAPILKDRPFAAILSVGAQGRFSHYSTVGNTYTYQFNGVYAPIRAVSFRGSYGKSVRAPNIGDLFQPLTGSSNFFDDPCYIANRNIGTQYRTANCLALIRQYGGDPTTFTAANNPNAITYLPGSTQGNPDLKAEVAHTWTAGVVLRPDFLRGFVVSADWYDIRIGNAILSNASLDPNNFANACVDSLTTNNVFCQSIFRQQGTGFISGYAIAPQNVSIYRTSGLDLNVDYQFRTARYGSFDLRLVGGYLHTLAQVRTPGSVTENNVDQAYRPKFNFVFSPTWTMGRVTLSYNLRWQDATRRIARITTDRNPSYIDPAYFRIKALWQHDLQAQYLWPNGFALYAGVTNLADQKPDVLGPYVDVDRPISPVGRAFYAGAKLRFGRK